MGKWDLTSICFHAIFTLNNSVYETNSTCHYNFCLCFLPYNQESKLPGKGRRAHKYKKVCGGVYRLQAYRSGNIRKHKPDLDQNNLFNSFGKLSAYGNKCDFSVGDKLYLRRLYSTPDIHGNWTYQIENDSSVVYRVSDYKYENNVLVRASF